MSVENSPVKQHVNASMNSSASSAMSLEPLRCSWADEVQGAERDEPNLQKSLNNSIDSQKSVALKSVPEAMDQSQASEDALSVSQDREISLEFIDGKNEEKFERLVKEEKLKTPFKRRHSQTPSNESRSSSPNSSNSDGGHAKLHKHTQHSKEDTQKRQRNNSSGSSTSGPQVEKDPAILARRQKQIDYGKNTLAYERYIQMVPRRERKREHPRTPNKYGKYSRRTFDGLIKVWRKQLHYYDAPEDAKATAENAGNDTDSSDSD